MKTYIITKACVKCGACLENCPVGAITMGKDQCFIDKSICVRCGMCYQLCSFDAIKVEDES